MLLPVTEKYLAELEKGEYHSLVELYRQHTTLSPKLDMLIVIHNLLFIKRNPEFIQKAVAFFNQHKDYERNPYLLSEKDWHNGVLRDEWGVSFHFYHRDDTGTPQSQSLLEANERTIQTLMYQYEQAKKNFRLDAFFQSFRFDAKKGCIGERLQNPLSQDWSTPSTLYELLTAFMQTLPVEVEAAEVLFNYEAFFAPYENQIISHDNQNQPLTRALVLDTLTALYGFDFTSVIPSPSTKSADKKWYDKSWIEIKQEATHCAYTASGRNLIFYFAQKNAADNFLNWVKNQEVLRPFSIMLSSLHNKGSQYSVLLSAEQFDILENTPEVRNSGENIDTLPPSPLSITDSGYNSAEDVSSLTQDQNNLQKNLEEIKKYFSLSGVRYPIKHRVERIVHFVDLMNNALKENKKTFSTLFNGAPTASHFTLSANSYKEKIKKLDYKTLHSYLTTQEGASYYNAIITLLQNLIANLKHDTVLETTLFAQLLNIKLILHKNEYLTPLHYAANFQNENTFLTMLEKASPEALNQAVLIQDNQKRTPLHSAARYQSEKAFRALLDKIPTDLINKVILMQDDNHNLTFLHIAAQYQGENAFLTMLEKLSPVALNKALLIQDNLKWTPIHTAACYQSEKAFLALLEKTSTDMLNKAMLMHDDTHNLTLLSLVAQYQSENAFFPLIEKISPEVLNQSLLIQDNQKWTLLDRAAYYQSKIAFKALIEKVSPQILNQILTMQNNAFGTLLHLIISHQSDNAFQNLMAKVSAKELNQALLIQSNEKHTPLHLVAAQYQNEQAFFALLEKIFPETLNKVLLIKLNDNWTLLHQAAHNQSEKAFLALIEKIPPETLDQILLIENKEKLTPLHLAARYQNEKAFLALIEKVSPETLNQALTMQSNGKLTLLHYVAQYQSEEVFLALLNKASPEALSKAIRMQDANNLTPLHLTAQDKSEKALLVLIEKVSPESLNEILLMQDNTNRTPLHLIIKLQGKKVFLELLEKIQPKVLNQALTRKYTNNYGTLLFFAARNQEKTAFLALLEKISPELLNQELIIQDATTHTLLELVARYQSENNFITLIDKIQAQRLNEALLIKNHHNWTPLHKTARHQSEKAFLMLLNRASSVSLQKACSIHLENINFVGELKNILGIVLKFQSPRAINILINKLDNKSLIQDLISQDKEVFTQLYQSCLFDPSIEMLPDKIFNLIMKIGKDTFYPSLNKAYSKGVEIPTRVMKWLEKENAKNISTLLRKEVSLHQKVEECITSSNALIKIIKPEHWDNLLEQLSNPQYRNSFQLPKAPEEKIYRFNFLTNQIEPYRKKRAPEELPLATKKTPATLLSYEKMTAVFGEHDKDRELVGLLFDWRHCLIKAMLAQDGGTYYREWAATTQERINHYTANIQNISFQQEQVNDFKERANTNPFAHNEVLFSIPYAQIKDALVAIVIAKDSPRARVLAQEKRELIQEKIGCELPIILYDRHSKTTEMLNIQENVPRKKLT